MQIAAVVTTYNQPAFLSLVLEGFGAQGDKDFSLVIADDGSTAETLRLVEAYKKTAFFGVSHVWQEDRGFRAAAVRNRAIARIKADYIIFVDGDCIPFPNFIRYHRHLAERGWFVAGNRILLSESFSRRIVSERLPIHTWSLIRFVGLRFRGEINRWAPLFFLPGNSSLRKLFSGNWNGIKTCNLACWREDLLKINGLDESYTGWGLEDSDLVIRLLRMGRRRKSGRFAVPVLHLWHPEQDRKGLAENQKRLDELLRSNRIEAIQGIRKYL